MFCPRVHQLVLGEDNDQLSMHHRGLDRLHTLVKLPPLAPQRDLQDTVQSLLASSVVWWDTTPMLVRTGTLTHPLEAMSRASNRLQHLTRDSALPESTKSVLMLVLVLMQQTPTSDSIVTISMFYINSIPAAILFDSRATHSFISAHYANTNELPLQTMQKPLIVITPKGPIEANYMTHRLTLTIMGREF
jgi:hypothetical protein